MSALSRLCVSEDWCEGTLCKIQRRAIRVVCQQKSRKVTPGFHIGGGGRHVAAAEGRRVTDVTRGCLSVSERARNGMY